MQQLSKNLAPVLIHTGFCLLSAILLRYAFGSGNHIVLGGLPLVFLAIVLPTLYFGWPPPFGSLLEPLERVPLRRAILVSCGALLIGYAAIAAVVFQSPILSAWADAGIYLAGAGMLYLAHKRKRGHAPRQRL